jgi:hypothetical protein
VIKSELIDRISVQNPHLYRQDAEKIVNTIFSQITAAMARGDRVRDVPLFVEHCEAVATEIGVKLRWLGGQARRGLSFLFGALPGRHVALEVACEPSVVGSLWLLPA